MEIVVNFVGDFGKKRCPGDEFSGDTVETNGGNGHGREVVGSDKSGVAVELHEFFGAN